MIDPQRSLIRPGGNFGRGRIGARPECSLKIIWQGITSQQCRDFAAYRNRQRVAGKGGGVDSLPLRLRRHREYLRRPQNLPEPLVLREVKCLAAAIVNMRNEHRPAVGYAKFVSRKRREAPRVHVAFVIEKISRVERSIAHKLEQASMHLIA